MGRCRLDELKEGETGRVISIENSGSIRRRLQDIGMVRGSLVRCIQKSPLETRLPMGYAVR